MRSRVCSPLSSPSKRACNLRADAANFSPLAANRMLYNIVCRNPGDTNVLDGAALVEESRALAIATQRAVSIDDNKSTVGMQVSGNLATLNNRIVLLTTSYFTVNEFRSMSEWEVAPEL